MVASELAPHARLTPAGDSIAALAKALRQLGHTVTVALPQSPAFATSGPLLARRLSPLVIEPGQDVTVLDGQLVSGVHVVLFDAPEFSAAAASADPAVHGRSVALLCRAAAALVRERKEQKKGFDIVHAHDGAAAPVARLLAEQGGVPVVVTVHDLAREASYAASDLVGLGEGLADPRVRVGGRVSPLRLGLLAARAITTVSPRYAEELRSSSSLATLLGQLPEPLVGILGGVDYAVFNPATDAAIDSRFDAEDVSNKGTCKTALLRATGLELEERPLFVVLADGCLAADRRALLHALPRLLDQDVAVVVAGADPELRSELSPLLEDYAGSLALARSEEGELRRCLAAADFAVPLRDAPASPLAMAAQRYGALPVAPAAGGVADVVTDADAELETGTGFVYADAEGGLVGAATRALAAFQHPRFPSFRRRVMRRDLGWDRPARRYAQIYRQARGESGPS